MKKRMVEVYTYKRHPKEKGGGFIYPHEKESDYLGWFHEWGIEHEEYENGPGMYTVAIIEKDDGSIKTVIPDLIRFVDKK